jgi:peroxiredoxin
MKKLFFLIFFFIINMALFAQKNKKPFNPDDFLKKQDSLNKIAIGKPYPDFEHKGDDGVVYSNKKMLGKKYYINFWFEACHPCMDEMDALIILNNKLKNTNNEFISFTFDIPSTVRRVREERKLNFKIIPVSSEECRRLNFNNGFPKHIVVDEKGNIEYFSSSYKSNGETIKEITALLINKSTVQ